MYFFFFFFLFLFPSENVTSLKCQVSHFTNLLHLNSINQPVEEECTTGNSIESMFRSKMGIVAAYIYRKSNFFSCFTAIAVPSFAVKEIQIKGCVPNGGCPAVKMLFGLVKKVKAVTSYVVPAAFKDSHCITCSGDMCNEKVIPGKDNNFSVPGFPHSELSCQVSHLSNLFSFGKTNDAKYEPEECLSSLNVKLINDKLGSIGEFLEKNILYTCFTITATPRLAFSPIKIKGCMPHGGCGVMRKVFSTLKYGGGYVATAIKKLLFRSVTCEECVGNDCNSPLYEKDLAVDVKRSCEVSTLTDIVKSGRLRYKTSKKEVCLNSKDVNSLMVEYENTGQYLRKKNTLSCFSVSTTLAETPEDVKIKGCVPKGGCGTLVKIFSNTKSANGTPMFKNVKCKECQGEICNKDVPPKPKSVAPKINIFVYLTFLVLITHVIF